MTGNRRRAGPGRFRGQAWRAAGWVLALTFALTFWLALALFLVIGVAR